MNNKKNKNGFKKESVLIFLLQIGKIAY